MKVMPARNAKRPFGLLIDTARVETAVIEKLRAPRSWWSPPRRSSNGLGRWMRPHPTSRGRSEGKERWSNRREKMNSWPR